MMNIKVIALFALIVSWLPAAAPAAVIAVNALRLWDAPDSTRVVLDIDAPVNFKVYTLDNPLRLVVDMEARLKAALPQVAADHPLLHRVRGANRGAGAARVVFDLKVGAPHESFVLPPNQEYGHRLVIDLQNPAAPAAQQRKPTEPQSREVVVAIDAGHGGEDPGARGPRGTYEKAVVLEIARRLERLVNSQKGMRAVMTREGDYYLSLRKRIEKARGEKADLFVSIHADAYTNPRARGSSVFVLSSQGASDEASRWLAERENAADLVGGVSIDDKDATLASVLLDLSLTGTIDVSTRVAQKVLEEIGRVTPAHKPSVQYAGFVVLKSPDIPSLLVETAFISNPKEEARLRDSQYQEKMANAIMRGVYAYFAANPLPGTLLAAQAYSEVRRPVIAAQ